MSEGKSDSIKHIFSDGVYAKETFIAKDSILVQHRHVYDHISILAKGSVLFSKGNTVSVLAAPACVEIKKGEHHGVRALEDSVWYCIHATDCKDETLVDGVLVQESDKLEADNLYDILAG